MGYYMDFFAQYLTLKAIITELFEFYPNDIIQYIMKLRMTPPTIDIFCRESHTFIIKDFFGQKTLQYYGKDNYEDAVSVKFNLIGNNFNAGKYDASMILPCQEKVVHFSQFEYDKVRDIFANQEQLQYRAYHKGANQTVCKFPEKVMKTFHGDDRLYVLSKTRRTIYGLQYEDDIVYPGFDLCHGTSNVKLFYYEFPEEIKKIICDGRSTYILTMTGNLYEWLDNDPSIQIKLNTQSYIDFDVSAQMPPMCLTVNGTVYIINGINDLIELKIDEPVKEIYCRNSHATILTESGKIYMCDGFDFTLHIANTARLYHKLYDGFRHSFRISKKGKMYAVGNNDYWQLGIGKTETIDEPQLVSL